MNLTNKTLAAFLVLAIVVSIGGTIVTLNRLQEAPQQSTGLATGQVDVTVSGNADLEIFQNVSFGTGTVVQRQVITTETDNVHNGFTGGSVTNCSLSYSGCGGMLLNNTGNVEINISFYASETAAQFIGGTNPIWQYKVANGSNSAVSSDEEGTYPGCHNFTTVSYSAGGSYGDVPQGGGNAEVICRWLNFTDGQDIVRIEFNLTIPSDTTVGAKSATLNFEIEQVS